jgi:hypothetical protein
MKPPSFSSTFQVSKKIRFTASSALTNCVIQDLDVVSLLQMAATSVTAYTLQGAAKISEIELWGPPPTGSGDSTVSVEWKPSVYIGAPASIVSDTCLGSTFPSHVKTRPPKNSLAANWLLTDGNEVMVLNAPTGSVVDLTITLTLASGLGIYPYAFTIVGGAAGQVFLAPLDNSSTKYLVPVSYAVV